MTKHSAKQFILSLSICVLSASATHAITVSSVADTGLYNIFEMSLDPTDGGIYVNGFPSGSGLLSVAKVSSGSLVTLYSPLPGTTGGSLQYTNGFAVHGSELWWNNANAGPGFATQLSRAPKSGAGPITSTSPFDDLDALSSDGTTLFTAYYAGSLYTVTPAGGVASIGFHRGTSHLSIAAEAGILYVADDTGLYRRNVNGTFTNMVSAANRYLTNGDRMDAGGGYVYALDRNNRNGYWQIDALTGADTFITDAAFTNLNSINYHDGSLYVSDTGEVSGPNVNGHVWQVSSTPVPEPSTTALGLVALLVGLCGRFRSPSRV